jgi:hypothetical protein
VPVASRQRTAANADRTAIDERRLGRPPKQRSPESPEKDSIGVPTAFAAKTDDSESPRWRLDAKRHGPNDNVDELNDGHRRHDEVSKDAKAPNGL